MQLLILLTILGWGVGSLFYKIANDNMHPIMVSAAITVLFMVITPLAFIFLKFDHKFNTVGIVAAVLGGACMCAGSMSYFFALRGGHAGLITALTALYPALTLILSMIFLGEHISFKQGIGILLALASFIILGIK
jgi:bacterial/archaeal transporter family protein